MSPDVCQQRSRAARDRACLWASGLSNNPTTVLPLANYKVVTETKSAALSCAYRVGKLLRNPWKR